MQAQGRTAGEDQNQEAWRTAFWEAARAEEGCGIRKSSLRPTGLKGRVLSGPPCSRWKVVSVPAYRVAVMTRLHAQESTWPWGSQPGSGPFPALP